jgi:long-chain acyl-CoA synthetase
MISQILKEKYMYKNLAEMFIHSKNKFGKLPSFATKSKHKEFDCITYSELFDMSLNLATALIDLGVNARDHVAIIADNRLEWIISDLAVIFCGAADVPRGADVTDGDIQYILPHADIKIVFVENSIVLKKLEKNIKHLPLIQKIILMDREIKTSGGFLHLYDLIDKGKLLRKTGDRKVEERIKNIKEDDLFTLIYTSGTTGAPKGVMLTHQNMVFQIQNLPISINTSDSILSILPVWHIFERVFEMMAIASGCCTYYTNVRNLKEDIQIVKPNFMASAPRLWESIYIGIFNNLEKSSFLKRILFHTAYFFSKNYNRARRFINFTELDINGRRKILSFLRGIGELLVITLFYIPNKIFDLIILSKIRKATGGRLRATVSGGGALPEHVDMFFNNVGIPVLEGYGLTETSPVISVRTLDKLVIGTVGPLYNKTELRLIDISNGQVIFPGNKGIGRKGEIHIRGPQLMKGYYKNEEATKKVLKDGWLNTGDLGILTYNNCLKIVGRSKETIVLLGGENVEPVPIENALLQSNLIDQCMLVGQDKKFLAVLIVPNQELLKNYGSTLLEISNSKEVDKLIRDEIKKIISTEKGFKSFEKVIDFRLLPKSFELGEELTAKLSIKRHIVSDKYKNIIDEIYKSKT